MWLTIAVVTPIRRRGVKQRSARIAGIDGCVDLDHVLERAAALRRDFPPQPAHDTRRQRLVEAERAADGEHLLTDLQVAPDFPDRDRLQTRGRARLILRTARSACGVDADHLGRVGDAVRKHHLDLAVAPPGVPNHVIIRDDISFAIPDEPAP